MTLDLSSTQKVIDGANPKGTSKSSGERFLQIAPIFRTTFSWSSEDDGMLAKPYSTGLRQAGFLPDTALIFSTAPPPGTSNRSPMFCSLLNSQCLEQCSGVFKLLRKCLWNECTSITYLFLLRVVPKQRGRDKENKTGQKRIRMLASVLLEEWIKKGVVYLYNETILSHTKEQSWSFL